MLPRSFFSSPFNVALLYLQIVHCRIQNLFILFLVVPLLQAIHVVFDPHVIVCKPWQSYLEISQPHDNVLMPHQLPFLLAHPIGIFWTFVVCKCWPFGCENADQGYLCCFVNSIVWKQRPFYNQVVLHTKIHKMKFIPIHDPYFVSSHCWSVSDVLGG